MSITRTLRSFLSYSLVSLAICGPYIRSSSPLQERQSGEDVVSGVGTRDENGNVYSRREVRDLKDNFPDQWNLYLLGLDSLQKVDQYDPYSYYSLAGIHGRPYKTWGNAPGLEHKIGTEGYCPHSNRLFVGWHRPYLTFFEEKLQQHVQSLASGAPEDQVQRFTAAATSFRMPYWDWAQGEKGGPVPDFFTTPTIPVTWPNGAQEDITNPFYSYRFHDLIPGDFDSKWVNISTTVRWPTSNEPNAESQQDKFKEAFISQHGNIIGQMGVTFRSSNFARFADQLEQPHGWMHGVIGGGWEPGEFQGHMWPLEYSAFEPLFMLHHTNVDRIFALYQAAHPDRRMEPFTLSGGSNVFLEDGQTVDENTELLPFRRPSGEFWTVKDCWDHKLLGYTYPETQPWNFATDEEYRASVEAVIANLYGASGTEEFVGRQAVPGGLALANPVGTFTEWTIEMQASLRQLPANFILGFSFIGDFSSDPNIDVGRWVRLMPSRRESKMVGPRNKRQIPKRASTLEKPFEGTITLTSHLLAQIRAGKLNSLSAEDVEPFLKDKLTWKLYSADGKLLPNPYLNSMSIEIHSTNARILEDINKPIQYNESTTAHPWVTRGKLGGV